MRKGDSKMQKKKWWLMIVLGIVGIFAICLLKSCNRTITEYDKNSTQSFAHPLVYVKGVSSKIGTQEFCTTEAGLFYANGNLLRFFDLEEKKRYILCTETVCSHNSSSCPAWYEKPGDMEGIAVHNEKIYAFVKNQKNNTYELTEMNMLAKDRKIIASLPIGNYEVGEWYLNGFDEVYYCGDMVWATLVMEYIASEEEGSLHTKLINKSIGISLKTGEIKELHETYEDDANPIWTFEAFSEDKIVLREETWVNDVLSEKEFRTEYTKSPENFNIPDDWQNKFSEEGAMWIYGYERYLEYQKKVYNYYLLELEDMSMKLLFQEEPYEEFWEDGMLNLRMSNYRFRGWNDGKLIVEDFMLESDMGAIYTVNEDNGSMELLLEIESGGIVAIEQGDFMDGLLVANYIDDGKCNICHYDYQTEELKFLFEDVQEISFRPIGETSKYFIGRMNESASLGVIEKQDYYAGDFDKMKEIFVW